MLDLEGTLASWSDLLSLTSLSSGYFNAVWAPSAMTHSLFCLIHIPWRTTLLPSNQSLGPSNLPSLIAALNPEGSQKKMSCFSKSQAFKYF